MDDNEINKYEAIRYTNKTHLDTFVCNLNNPFEAPADGVIQQLILKYKNFFEKYSELSNQDIKTLCEKEVDNLENERFYCLIETEYLKDEIWSLIEMKIIYEFKFFELNLKKLIRNSFPDISTKDFYKWDSLVKFLRVKNIRPEKLKGFNEIMQLKEVNNSLKHSEEFDKKLINSIPEFRNKKNINFSDFDSFYLRIRSFPNIFLGDLANAILKELYEFDRKKIEKIADELALRMEGKDANELIKAIKSKYIW